MSLEDHGGGSPAKEGKWGGETATYPKKRTERGGGMEMEIGDGRLFGSGHHSKAWFEKQRRRSV